MTDGNDIQAWVLILTPVLVFLASWLTVKATKGKTQTDYKTAFDKRVDEKMGAYTDRLEARIEKMEREKSDLADRVDHLEDAQEASTRREMLLYRYTSLLRNHVLEGHPPPPPPIPEELQDWYENFEAGNQGLQGSA